MEAIAAAVRFFGVLDGVGSIVMGSIFGSPRWADVVFGFAREGLSESDCAPLGPAFTPFLCEYGVCLLGVLCNCLAGDAGDEGGELNCGGARAKRAFLTVVGGGVLCWRLNFGERSPLNEE